VRDARHADVVDIIRLGNSTTKFKVSDDIRFYEDFELREWIANPSDNILLVATESDETVGFLYCKLMSTHWALLDNFFCDANAARRGASKLLFDGLLGRLRASNHAYLTALIRADHAPLERLCRRYGFVPRDNYRWMDMFL
jgi:hypothetical protein